MSILHQLRKIFWRTGFDVCAFDAASNNLARKQEIFRKFGINIVLDVGANEGQFGRHIRHDLDYKGRIISFEPLSSAFEKLQKSAASDSLWQVDKFALGDDERETTINIALNSVSSSILEMARTHLNSVPSSRFVGTEKVRVKTLDSIFGEICSTNDNVFLKIDTQGFENKVLQGAYRSLDRISTIQLELSLVELYRGEATFGEMFGQMRQKGYDLISIEPVYFGEIPGQILQVDGIFHRVRNGDRDL